MKQSPNQAEHIKQLEWVIWFSQADLDGFREGDWINLIGDLRSFVFHSTAPTGHGYLGTSRLVSLRRKGGVYQHRNPTKEEITGIQKQVLEDLRNLSVNVKVPQHHTITRPIERVAIAVEGFNPDADPFMYALDLGENQGEGYYVQESEARVRAALFEYLVGSRILRGQLRVCPDCSRLFLLRRKPRPDMTFHCSLKCSRLAATRAYRQKNEGKLKPKERERSHRRYEQKVRQKPGHAHSKVTRRPRKARGG